MEIATFSGDLCNEADLSVLYIILDKLNLWIKKEEIKYDIVVIIFLFFYTLQ